MKSGPLLPDPFQSSLELPLGQGSLQVLLTQSVADPPDLKTPKRKGEQTQLEASLVHAIQMGASHPCFKPFVRFPEILVGLKKVKCRTLSENP